MTKRAMDIIVAGIGLLVLFPLFLIIMAAIRKNMGSPVFFRQVRPGRHGRPFHMIKFRTMRNAIGSDGDPLPDSDRLTRLGRLLRQTSIDELPELWNVLKGDMSLVGPRPLLMEYLPLYSREQSRRHEVRPGITGWAQVNGRNALSWADKFEFDVWYVDNRSFWLDSYILALTIWKVLKSEGISGVGEATASKFTGR